MDFLLTGHPDETAARRLLHTMIRRHGVPETITIDGSAANATAIRCYHREHSTAILIGQGKYLNPIVEQDRRAVQRLTCPMLGCKSLTAAHDTLVEIALMPMLKKRQLVVAKGAEGRTAAAQCYALAASSPT